MLRRLRFRRRLGLMLARGFRRLASLLRSSAVTAHFLAIRSAAAVAMIIMMLGMMAADKRDRDQNSAKNFHFSTSFFEITIILSKFRPF